MASLSTEPLYPMTTTSTATATTTTTHPSPVELRHITSNTNLATPLANADSPTATASTSAAIASARARQHPSPPRPPRCKSPPPHMLPRSHPHRHSSSSAIFERDIEPIASSQSSLLSISSDPHRIPRGKYTEQLEQSVPSVLDSAATILADDDFDSISIVAPAPPDAGYHSGFTSPISRLSSRSPSPTGQRKSLLFSASPPLPTIETAATATVPSSAISDAGSTSSASSPTTATHPTHPVHAFTLPAPALAPPSTSHPPSPKNSTKRLSFLSYMDLLSSTPASTLPLSSLTCSAEPPPHLPSVIGLAQAQALSSAGSIHGVSAFERESAMSVADDVGGEWEREGLGKGLEERLEALKAVPGKA
ncbi:hypothetical protein A0H81_02154 [Grifola frondosa]|uniref:Uncharacterized protein n=1 Tax=Grifola frondosa TaxID=5627 RepID=A0A1C7MMF2_GRIFR|nr:hypothetical protein A0H81_02154 [Grifola frondosa]